MAQFRLSMQRTDAGDVALYWAQFVPRLNRPVVAFVHGALRNAEVLAHWGEVLKDVADVVLVDLPGHGRSASLMPATIDAMATSVHEALCTALRGRYVLLVGESLGGLVTLAIGGRAEVGPIHGILAADPPLTTAKQWQVADNFRSAMLRTPEDAFLASFGHEVWGISANKVEERIYYPLIGALRIPAVIATGDIPLLPPRTISDVACLFDDVDRFVVN